MAVAMRTNGLHHAVSLGTIEVSGKTGCGGQFDRSYDSEDENMSRRRLRHTSSTELYPRASVYSKGDIREQYCLTDRQLHSIERPRRERFFGCLSRRGAPQSFLGVCVGRRAPSDENLAAYAPFYKYPRYHQQQPYGQKSPDSDLDSSYFRRQPASILSTAKMNTDSATTSLAGARYPWIGGMQTGGTGPGIATNANYMTNEQSSYHCPTHVGHLNPATAVPPLQQLQQQQQHQQQQPPQMGPATPRTKHVSFARSHTLTSFDDVNLGLRSSGRLKTATSQERLIGGKKPIIASGSIYDPAVQPFVGAPPIALHQHQHQHQHMHPHLHGHGHSHQHHHGPIHVHQFVPAYGADAVAAQVQTEQPMSSSLLSNRPTLLLDDMGGLGVGVLACAPQGRPPLSPEVLVVEKKFRNAMKTQATQTDPRSKDGALASTLSLSPRTVHKVAVKVVSQGAQTNGLQNGKKLAKSLSEMPNRPIASIRSDIHGLDQAQLREHLEHEALFRTQSEEPPRSPLEFFQANVDGQNNINYYKPPPPLVSTQYASHYPQPSSNCRSFGANAEESPLYAAQGTATDTRSMFNFHVPDDDTSAHYDDSYMGSAFDYESNSLPRRACSYHRLENEFSSHSLPRREPMHSNDVCKHITECSELMSETNSLDFSRLHLLPPPSEYCKDDDEKEDDLPEREPAPAPIVVEEMAPPEAYATTNRRKSMVSVSQHEGEASFRRDDIRRQSMPLYVKTEKLIDGYDARTISRLRAKPAAVVPDNFEEEEIFIDFKPHISPRSSPLAQPNYRKLKQTASDAAKLQEVKEYWRQEEDDKESCCEEAIDSATASEEEDDVEREDPLYENIPSCMCAYPEQQQPLDANTLRKENFRKRSVSLDDAGESEDKLTGLSAPPSPGRDEMLANASSTYPSSDSLANDVTRDHSDGIWNESQVTVLTADQRELSESSFNSNMLLTPSSKRKNLILQHQQRSSIDTDVLDLEEQLADHSPTYSNVSLPKAFKQSVAMAPQPAVRESKAMLTVPTKIVTPSIAVTPSMGSSQDIVELSKSPNVSRRQSYSYASSSPLEVRKMEQLRGQSPQHKILDFGRPESTRIHLNNADLSECSTNTDEYATCTDNSKRTPGIKTPPTITSSSSTTHVPVSTQSSQITDKTHGGSSFESASSLYSIRGEAISEELFQQEEKSLATSRSEKGSKLGSPMMDASAKSPTHSISSTSSGSYNVAGLPVASPIKEAKGRTGPSPIPGIAVKVPQPPKDTAKAPTESVSDDERSEVRYSSSGYYESPHDEDQIAIFRRHRVDEDRKRRKTSMKLDIEKENMRALTSPIKRPIAPTPAGTLTTTSKDKSPEKQQPLQKVDITSPNKIKRFRPKIRRQFRRSSRDESTPPRRQKNLVGIYGLAATGSTEKLLDCSLATATTTTSTGIEARSAKLEDHADQHVLEPKAKVIPSPIVVKSASETCQQLKAKSIESLRSVSPGSDSVFYSEADGPVGVDQHSHCLHCGKGMEGQSSVVGGDSVESLPCIEHEQDIVKPPSDFADSPVTIKTTQRLYKKMDKRFRSEERYHGERGRHYKSRQDNIRAKSEERSRESNIRSPVALRPAGSSPCVLPDTGSDPQLSQQIIYRGHYDAGRYTRLTDADVWTQLDHQSFDRHRDRRASTDSERSFHTKYQVILHRLVQRRCTLEMYHRQKSNTFQLISSGDAPESLRKKLEEVLKLMLLVWAREGHVLSMITGGARGTYECVDKTVVVKSDSGEFGFRIHGSKPVVVAAIEPETPAESSGLEVGDIIISVNGIQVLDKHHTEVVKIAHDGCETLELQVARTIGILMNEQQEPAGQPIFSGYLWRQSGQAKGSPNTKKWVRRWFCLRPDNCLYYYKTEDDSQPVGAMIMAKHTIEYCPPEIGKPFAFKVDSGEGIPMYVAADSEELTNRWTKILKQSAAHDNPWLDKAARNLYQQPSSIVRPDCFGYLMKLGSRWCGWSKRYCVLKDACLYFYQDANSKTAFGMACLHGYKVASMSASASGKKNSFEIIPPEAKLRHYYFSTESEMDKKRWISAMEYSIDRWIKSG